MTDLIFSGGARVRPLTIIRSPRAKQMRLRVDQRNGAVRLTLPRRAGLAHALAWVQTKRSWIEGQLAGLPVLQPITPVMAFSFCGDRVTLDWAAQYPRTPQRIGDQLRIGGPLEMLDARLQRWLKREAKVLFTRETFEFAAKIGVSIASVGIGDPVSRWGSCATSGAIRYSWRLILAPAFVRRATIAHEVAHRIHMNHGPEFHALVKALFGEDPGGARAWLRCNGAALHGFGRLS